MLLHTNKPLFCCRKLLLQQSLIEIWSLLSKSPKTLKWYNSSGHLGNFTLLEILYIILFSSFIEKYDLEIWKYVFQCNHMLYGYPHALIGTLFLLTFHFQFLFLKEIISLFWNAFFSWRTSALLSLKCILFGSSCGIINWPHSSVWFQWIRHVSLEAPFHYSSGFLLCKDRQISVCQPVIYFLFGDF